MSIPRELIVFLSSPFEEWLPPIRRSQHLSAHAITSRAGSADFAMLSVTDERGLIPDGLEINFVPGAPHLAQLLLIRQHSRERLRDLIDVQKPH
jgi:hypothetical protein